MSSRKKKEGIILYRLVFPKEISFVFYVNVKRIEYTFRI